MKNGKGRMNGKVAVVTGAALGIGRACAQMLAREGASVAVTDLLDAEGQAVVNEICNEGGTAGYWHMDVTDEQQVSDVMGMVRSRFGPVTVLVNNAGITGEDKSTHEFTTEEWEEVMDVNVKGAYLCIKYAVPQMIRKGGGSVVNVSSVYGIVGGPGLAGYHAAEGALRSMTKTDAVTYAPRQVRVNSVHPGVIWTPMVEGLIAAEEDVVHERAELGAKHPLGHVGEPDDVAFAVLYLASDEARFVTGAELVVDGGYTAR
ncbi:MAG: glucose 1-dehydrogenase [Armatimonadetes bacterium]|nr:glucose 1-dehydrogenase [Armatimonadota bacterium]